MAPACAQTARRLNPTARATRPRRLRPPAYHRVRPASLSGPISTHATRNRSRAPPARRLHIPATSRSAAVPPGRQPKPGGLPGHHLFAPRPRVLRRTARRRWRRHALRARPSTPNMPRSDFLNAPYRQNALRRSSIFRQPASAFLFLLGTSSTSPSLRRRRRPVLRRRFHRRGPRLWRQRRAAPPAISRAPTAAYACSSPPFARPARCSVPVVACR
jgi:hypothetical protein